MDIVRLDDPKNRVILVWTTDWHLTDVPPARRQDDYCRAVLAKVDFVRALAERLSGVGVCGGDVFHHKAPRHAGNSFRLIVDLLNALRRFPQGCVFGSVGNHDISYDRMDTLPRQPLGVLVEAGVYRDLNRRPVLFESADGATRVSLETFPFAEGDATVRNILGSGPRQGGVDYRVGVVHAYGHPGGPGSMFGTRTIGYDELAGADFDALLWGHDHSRHETVEVGGVTHVNLGSLARAAFAYDEVERPVVAAVLSFSAEGMAYGEKAVPVKPLEVAFAAADKAVEKAGESEEIASFFADMDTAVLGMEQVNDPRAVIMELCADDPKLAALLLELCDL